MLANTQKGKSVPETKRLVLGWTSGFCWGGSEDRGGLKAGRVEVVHMKRLKDRGAATATAALKAAILILWGLP